MSFTKLSLAGNNLMSPARERLVSDISAWNGKKYNHFLHCVPLNLPYVPEMLQGYFP
jgi:hypothetical protein